MKQILILAAIILAASCAKKVEPAPVDAPSSEETELQKRLVKEYNLPPEPDVEENNATINGVDINNNLIRDDWERAIVFKYYYDQTKMNLHNANARNSTLLNKYYEEMNVSEYIETSQKTKDIISCNFFLYGINAAYDKSLMFMSENTKESYMLLKEVAIWLSIPDQVGKELVIVN